VGVRVDFGQDRPLGGVAPDQTQTLPTGLDELFNYPVGTRANFTPSAAADIQSNSGNVSSPCGALRLAFRF
jgi:hypothetical protein